MAGLLTLIVTTGAGTSAPPWPVERGSAPVLPRFVYSEALLRTVPAEFLRDAPACYLYSGTTETLEPAGVLSSTTQECIRLNSRRGIDQFGEYRNITFNPAYEQVTLHAARVHKARGGSRDVEPRHLHVRDVNTDHHVYDPSKQVVISFPNLEVNDVIEVHWTVRGRHPEYHDQFFHRYTFGDEKLPVFRDDWCVRLPKDRMLRYAAINGQISATVIDDGPWREYLWSAESLRPLRSRDRPGMNDDRRMQIACTTFADWDAVHRWEQNLLAGRSECPPEGQRLVAELTRGLTEPTAKARVLARWVCDNIRYVSRGEKHDYTPHAPARTLADRFGDCKDGAHLLAVLLRHVGLEAGVVTLGPRGDGQIVESLPSPWGTHALTVVTIDGRDYWIDTTAGRIGWNVLPRDDSDRVCYISTPAGIRVTRTPKSLPSDHRTEMTTSLTVAPSGNVAGVRTIRYHGVAAWQKREDLADLTQAELRSKLAAEIQDAIPHARIERVELDSLEDPDKPLTVRIPLSAAELFVGDGASEARLNDATIWIAAIAADLEGDPDGPLDIGDPAELISRWEIRLPALYRLASAPDRHVAESRWGRLEVSLRNSEEDPRRIELETRTTLLESQVAPADFESFREFASTLEATARVPLALSVTRDPADAPALEAEYARSPSDARTAQALAEIYIAEKKFDEAQRVLVRACTADPTVRKLWELRATATIDLVDQEQVFRGMVRQFPDEPRYVLQLGENLLDQDRPADAAAVLQGLRDSTQPKIRAAALVTLAHCDMAVDEPKKALRRLRDAMKADPDGFNADAWFLKAQAHEALHESAPAIEAYRRALADEEAVDALAALTRLLIATGQKADAVGTFRRLCAAISKDPGELAVAADLAVRLERYEDALDLADLARADRGALHPLAHRPLGLARFHRREYAQAAEELERAEPDAEVLVSLVHALVRLGRLAEAERQLARFDAVEPTPETRDARAWVRSIAHRRDEMLKSLPAEVAATPSTRQSADRVACAVAMFLAGQPADLIDRLIDPRTFPESVVGAELGLRAVIQVSRGRLAAAQRDAERAIALAPTDPLGYRARGRIRLERNQPGGLEDLERAVELTGRTEPGALTDLAYGYFLVGRLRDAAAIQREASRLNAESADVREQLRNLGQLVGSATKNPG